RSRTPSCRLSGSSKSCSPIVTQVAHRLFRCCSIFKALLLEKSSYWACLGCRSRSISPRRSLTSASPSIHSLRARSWLPITPIARFLRHYERLLELAAANPDLPIGKFQILSDHERRQLLYDWNETTVSFPQCCIHDLFEAQARQNPDSVAVVFKEQQITYRDLDRRADQVARQLRTMDVKPEVVVGICLERSPELVIGLLGILKAGGAYLPIDPAYPLERIGFMIEDSGMQVLLTQEKLFRDLPLSRCSVLCLDRLPEIPMLSNVQVTAQPSDLAYVIYT